MNSLKFSAKLFALALVFAFTGCTPDQVKPTSSTVMYESGPALASESGIHPVVSPECSPRRIYQLIDKAGGMDVNYFGSGGNPNGNMVQWGSATLLNSDQEFVVEIDLAIGWYVERTELFVGNESGIIMQNGVPQVGEAWMQADVNPLVNATQLRIGLPFQSGECFNLALGLSIVHYDFALGIDENSRTQVWLGNTYWDDPMHPDLNTLSYAVGKWCVESCGN